MDYIRTNKLKAALGSTGKDPSQIRYGSGKIYRMYYSNQIVWDVLRTTFSASDFGIGANGGNVANNSNVTSYGINALGSRESLGWTCDPTTISANSSTSSKTHIIKYTQNGTGDTTTAICTQAGQSIVITGYRYSASVSNESIGTAEASGSTLTLNVSGTIYVYAQYSDGSESLYNSYGFGSTAATITSGTPESGRAYLSNGKVVVYSAGKTTYTGTRSVYYIYGYSFSVDGRSYTGSTYITVQQKQNSASDSYGIPTVSVTYGDVGANGSAASMAVTYSQTKTTTYTSEAPPDTQTLSGTVSNTSTSGSVYIYSISSSNSSNGGAVVTSGSSRGNVSASSLGYTAKDRSRVLTVTVTVRANGQNGSKTVDVYQAKNTVSSVFNTPVIGTVTVNGKAGANGVSGATVSVAYTQTKTTTSTASGSKTEQVANTTTTSATISGNTISNNGRVSNGAIIADKLPATASDEKHVFTITSVSITVNSVSNSKSVSLKVYQEANKVTSTTTKSHTVSISPTSQTNVSSAGATLSFTVKDTKVLTDTYTSTATADRSVNGTATVTINNGGYFGSAGTTSTSVTGTGTVSPTIPENISSARTFTISVTDKDDSSKKASATVSQNAVQYSFYASSLTDIKAGASEIQLTLEVVSTRNGKKYAISTSNITTSNSTFITIDSVSESNSTTTGTYSIFVTVKQNTSTSSRTATITATQPNSGNKATWTITQSGQTTSTKKAQFTGTAQYGISGTSVDYTVVKITNAKLSATGSNYSGGQLTNLYFVLSNKNDGSGTAINTKTFGNVYVANSSTTSIDFTSMSNPGGSDPVYILMYYDGQLQQSINVRIPIIPIG